MCGSRYREVQVIYILTSLYWRTNITILWLKTKPLCWLWGFLQHSKAAKYLINNFTLETIFAQPLIIDSVSVKQHVSIAWNVAHLDQTVVCLWAWMCCWCVCTCVFVLKEKGWRGEQTSYHWSSPQNPMMYPGENHLTSPMLRWTAEDWLFIQSTSTFVCVWQNIRHTALKEIFRTLLTNSKEV